MQPLPSTVTYTSAKKKKKQEKKRQDEGEMKKKRGSIHNSLGLNEVRCALK